MIIARRKRKENIAEYLLYMWQVEDLIRANQFDLDSIRRTVIAQYAQLQQDALLRLIFTYQRRIKHHRLRRLSEPFSFSYFLHQPEDLPLYRGRPLGVF